MSWKFVSLSAETILSDFNLWASYSLLAVQSLFINRMSNQLRFMFIHKTTAHVSWLVSVMCSITGESSYQYICYVFLRGMCSIPVNLLLPTPWTLLWLYWQNYTSSVTQRLKYTWYNLHSQKYLFHNLLYSDHFSPNVYTFCATW